MQHSNWQLTHLCDITTTDLPIVLTGHIVPRLSIESLICIRVLCKAGCKVVFTKNCCNVIYNNKVILQGRKDPSTNLWMLPLNALRGHDSHRGESGWTTYNPPWHLDHPNLQRSHIQCKWEQMQLILCINCCAIQNFQCCVKLHGAVSWQVTWISIKSWYLSTSTQARSLPRGTQKGHTMEYKAQYPRRQRWASLLSPVDPVLLPHVLLLF